MKDLHSSLSAVAAIGAATLTADETSAAVDLKGYQSAEILLAVGAGGITFSGSNKIEFVIEHSDDDSTYDAVADGDILGAAVESGGIVKALKAAHAAAAVYRVGYKGGRRYLKVKADFSGTHGTGTPLAVTVLRGHGSDNPQEDQA